MGNVPVVRLGQARDATREGLCTHGGEHGYSSVQFKAHVSMRCGDLPGMELLPYVCCARDRRSTQGSRIGPQLAPAIRAEARRFLANNPTLPDGSPRHWAAACCGSSCHARCQTGQLWPYWSGGWRSGQ